MAISNNYSYHSFGRAIDVDQTQGFIYTSYITTTNTSDYPFWTFTPEEPEIVLECGECGYMKYFDEGDFICQDCRRERSHNEREAPSLCS